MPTDRLQTIEQGSKTLTCNLVTKSGHRSSPERAFLEIRCLHSFDGQIQANVTKWPHEFRNRIPFFSRRKAKFYGQHILFACLPISSITVTLVVFVEGPVYTTSNARVPDLTIAGDPLRTPGHQDIIKIDKPWLSEARAQTPSPSTATPVTKGGATHGWSKRGDHVSWEGCRVLIILVHKLDLMYEAGLDKPKKIYFSAGCLVPSDTIGKQLKSTSAPMFTEQLDENPGVCSSSKFSSVSLAVEEFLNKGGESLGVNNPAGSPSCSDFSVGDSLETAMKRVHHLSNELAVVVTFVDELNGKTNGELEWRRLEHQTKQVLLRISQCEDMMRDMAIIPVNIFVAQSLQAKLVDSETAEESLRSEQALRWDSPAFSSGP
ncbi:hypothetical protein T265_04857 [Opisthorchis viverrini]|uniref:Uncharacterized protein n=1 Tax=Opisthorchis viverrini TaxID=6198 RepID=A0A074ZY78_OPIVI|nr:hypothetical protein T265_04857 [Opisthorchis viverrini]KER28255.1 hypothetical protein T265_04857 [Opisthorchis viverrini]